MSNVCIHGDAKYAANFTIIYTAVLVEKIICISNIIFDDIFHSHDAICYSISPYLQAHVLICIKSHPFTGARLFSNIVTPRKYQQKWHQKS